MAIPLPSWLTNAAAATRKLAECPTTLFLLLLAFNAVGRPCTSTSHDARLYSLQALNQAEHGAYADDVFLHYGSQDKYSLFSSIVGPTVALVGLRPAFFGFYLVVNTLFILALFRLVRAVIDDAVISTLALIFLVTAPLTYGGYDIFTVHEQFFTPRIIGTTLTLFALERLVRQRFVMAFLFLAAGLLMHPLMAFGGVLIWAGYLACTYLPTRVFAGLLITASVGGTIVLAIPMLGERLFGTIDDDWHHIIRIAVGYNYPDTWQLKDWINLTLSFAMPIAACFCVYRDDPVRRRFLLIVVLAGAVGFLATVAASLLPYALLFQGQPYRVLWTLKVLQIPLGFLLIAHWSQSPSLTAKLAALALVAYFCLAHGLRQELVIFAMMIPLSVLFAKMSAQDGWWWYGLARGCVLGAIGWTTYRCVFFVVQRETITQTFDVTEWLLFDLISPIVWLAGFCIVAACCGQLQPWATTRWASAAVALLTPIALFSLEIVPNFRRDHTRLGSDMAFLQKFVEEHHADKQTRPAIYCSQGRSDLLWIDVRATSYFDIIQTAGVMFNRQTAQEIWRRTGVIAKFEMARQRQDAAFLDDAKKVGMENLFQIPFDSQPPTQDDLVRLCREPGLDYVAIPQEFPGLYSASNGRIFVYECYKVRNTIPSSFSARVAPGGR